MTKKKAVKKSIADPDLEDEGGVAIYTGQERVHEDYHDEDFKGFGSDSDDEEKDGGAVLSKDHTAELLKGFESSSEDDDEAVAEIAEAEVDGASPRLVPTLPQSAQAAVSKTKKSKSNDNDPPIVLYVGRISHGFFEHQMRAYFSQFGDINHLRLGHNRKTGASKHFGFVEFTSGEVGRIVQRTMQGYIMFGHILQIKEVPQSKLDEYKAKGIDIWKGEGRRYKPVPHRAFQKKALDTASRDRWAKRIEKETTRRNEKAEKLKKLGYDFEMPEIKGVDTVPVLEPRSAVKVEKIIKADKGSVEEQPPSQKVERKPSSLGDDDTPDTKKVMKTKRASGNGNVPVVAVA